MASFKPSKLAIVSLYTGDIPSTVHFYKEVISLPLLQGHHHPIAFDIGGTYLVILPGDPPSSHEPDGPGFPLLTFEVDNLDEAVAYLQAHRVEILGSVNENNNTRWVLFHDPAGNLIEFAEFGN